MKNLFLSIALVVLLLGCIGLGADSISQRKLKDKAIHRAERAEKKADSLQREAAKAQAVVINLQVEQNTGKQRTRSKPRIRNGE